MSGPIDGVYFIRNVSSHTMLDANGPATSSHNVACYSYSFDKVDRQLWDVKIVGAGKYVIFQHGTTQVLDLSGSNANDGTPIITFPVHWGNNQTWKITSNGSAYHVTNVSSGKYLDLGASNTSDGAAVINYSFNGGYNNQLWEFKKVGPCKSCPRAYRQP